MRQPQFAGFGLALLDRLGELINRCREFRITGEHDIHANQPGAARLGREFKITAVGINGAAARVGHHQGIAQRIDEGIEESPLVVAAV